MIIYSLNHPNTNDVVYVGKTSQPLSKRLSGHLCDNSNERKSRWILELRKIGLKPTINYLAESDNRIEASRLEKDYIIQFLADGLELLNYQLSYKKIKRTPDNIFRLRADVTGESYSILSKVKGKLLLAEKPSKISDVVDFIIKDYNRLTSTTKIK